MTDDPTDDPTHLPVFPTTAPPVLSDPAATRQLFARVLDALAQVVELDDGQRRLPTPCSSFDAGRLQLHVLGWLDFFATAASDPPASSPRPDPDAFTLGPDGRAVDVVRDAASRLDAAIAAGAAGELVVMSSHRMAGDGVLGMALGEYLVHGWDLARATGRSYRPPSEAVEPALEFLAGVVAPEHRGPDSGLFDAEVPVADDAPPFDRLLGFAGRDPAWTPAADRGR